MTERAVSLPAWLGQGARTLILRAPRWERLRASPGLLALLVLLELCLTVGFQRLYISGAAIFNWEAASAGWIGTVLTAWACYVLRPGARDEHSPGAAELMALLLAQALWLTILVGLAYTWLLRSGALDNAPEWVQWASWITPVSWTMLAQLTLLLRSGQSGIGRRIAAVAAIALGAALTYFLARPPAFWTAPADEVVEAEEDAFQLTQETIEAQTPLLANQLRALKPQRPGVVDMYTITFAPYEGEEVFRRESEMVSDVMATRFDAAGRGLQLMNHRDTGARYPWATPLNLARAIGAVGQVMDRNEDVLFIHLTSHGASDGELAATFWPLDVQPVTPAALKIWLDGAGIQNRVLSVSACYSGSWIGPLADPGTLVMTASDAEHTSYGCGKKSPLTFFGRAMYDEQLRTATLSFEEAHAAARKLIAQREIEAGKNDGYSNPQIKVGAAIGPPLEKLRARLLKSSPSGSTSLPSDPKTRASWLASAGAQGTPPSR